MRSRGAACSRQLPAAAPCTRNQDSTSPESNSEANRSGAPARTRTFSPRQGNSPPGMGWNAGPVRSRSDRPHRMAWRALRVPRLRDSATRRAFHLGSAIIQTSRSLLSVGCTFRVARCRLKVDCALVFVEVGTLVARRPLTDPGGRYSRTGFFMSIRTRIRPPAGPRSQEIQRSLALPQFRLARPPFPSPFTAKARRKVCQSFSVVLTVLVPCAGGIDMSAPSVASGLWPCSNLL